MFSTLLLCKELPVFFYISISLSVLIVKTWHSQNILLLFIYYQTPTETLGQKVKLDKYI